MVQGRSFLHSLLSIRAKYKAESNGNQAAFTRAMSYRLASNTPRYLAQLAVIPVTGWTRAHIPAPGVPPAPRAPATTAVALVRVGVV
jgi:hypothetical protein